MSKPTYPIREWPAEGISEDSRIVAEGVAKLAASSLGLGRITVRYFVRLNATDDPAKKADALLDHLGYRLGFEPTDSWLDTDPLLGLARKDEPGNVWVDCLADNATLARTICHEVRHRWQYNAGWMDTPHETADLERDATAWADQHWPQLLSKVRELERTWRASHGG